MADVTINEVELTRVLAEASAEAVSIIASRVADDAKPLTRVLSTRPPGRKEWGYSLPAGRLRDSITWEAGTDGLDPFADVGVTARGIPLAHFRNIGGTGDAAYGDRGNNPSIMEATALQIDRPVP